jgi:dihydrofolate reductase
MKAIVAISENRVIGNKGGLPWPPIKEDFKWFNEFTINKTILIGSTTWKNMPIIPNRKILVLSKNYVDCWYNAFKDTAMSTVTLEEIHTLQKDGRDIIIAGGASIYNLFLSDIKQLYVTHVKGIYDGDTFMPPFEHLFENRDIIKEFDGHSVVRYSKN